MNNAKAIDNLVLSLFPGIGLLDRAFSQVGFCVVAGPDPIHGNDLSIENFHAPARHFAGVIAGPPCQAFSVARRGKVSAEERERAEALIGHCARVILEARPDWWLIENVPAVPNIKIDGYTHQRFDLRHDECDGTQRRRRHFQFGVKRTWNENDDGAWWTAPSSKLVIPRAVTSNARQFTPAPIGKDSLKISWKNLCAMMDLPENFKIESFSKPGAYKAVRNGVPLKMGVVIARAIKNLMEGNQVPVRICACGCGRPLREKQTSATPACRKRIERERKGTTQKVLHFQ